MILLLMSNSIICQAIPADSLTKKDCLALGSLYLWWLEQGKCEEFTLPLLVKNDGKSGLDLPSFKRIFFAFREKAKKNFIAFLQEGEAGNDSYKVVTVRLQKEGDTAPEFQEPKKTEVRRESSRLTKEKAVAKKAKATAEKSDAVAKWNRTASEKIGAYIASICKLSITEFNSVIDNIYKILQSLSK